MFLRDLSQSALQRKVKQKLVLRNSMRKRIDGAVIRAAVATTVARAALNGHICRLKECFGDRGTDSVRGRHSPLITRTKERSLN
jgi:hypothetical protein